MKVYIGPYENYYTTRSFEEWWFRRMYKKESWEVAEEAYTKTDKIVLKTSDIYYNLVLRPLNKFYAWKGRKVKVRIDDYDTWSMDHTLALIILPMLRQLQSEKHGSPWVEPKDVPTYLQPDPDRIKLSEEGKVEHWDVDNTVHDRWSWVLSEIIWAFEQIVDEDSDEQFYSGELGNQWQERIFDFEGYKKHHERIDRGLMFFGKYYRGLWD
jgi:hypothetical protein